MGKVIAFPQPVGLVEEIDLLTAVDVAIRDLREIAARSENCREQAVECLRMLERAYAETLPKTPPGRHSALIVTGD